MSLKLRTNIQHEPEIVSVARSQPTGYFLEDQSILRRVFAEMQAAFARARVGEACITVRSSITPELTTCLRGRSGIKVGMGSLFMFDLDITAGPEDIFARLRGPTSTEQFDELRDQLSRVAADFVPELRAAVDSDTEPGHIRAVALEALAGVLPPQESRKLVLANLGHSDPKMRTAAAEIAADLMPDARLKAELERLAEKDPNSIVRVVAADALRA